MNNYEKIQNYFKELGEMKVKYRTAKYTGKGRPKKTDFVVLKQKNLRDYQCFELFNNGFSTSYTQPAGVGAGTNMTRMGQ